MEVDSQPWRQNMTLTVGEEEMQFFVEALQHTDRCTRWSGHQRGSWCSFLGLQQRTDKKKTKIDLSPLSPLFLYLDPVEPHRFSHLIRTQTDAANPEPSVMCLECLEGEILVLPFSPWGQMFPIWWLHFSLHICNLSSSLPSKLNSFSVPQKKSGRSPWHTDHSPEEFGITRHVIRACKSP